MNDTRQGSRGDKSGLARITSAYNFAPLARTVVRPAWQDRVSHDHPLREGLCATLTIELRNHTPLLVGAERGGTGPDHPVRPWCHPDGVPALPGSSLRGMIRNVLEIASFSRMQLVDDRSISLRDVTAAGGAYRKRFAEETPSGAYKALAKAAWLRFVNGAWQIQRRGCARVNYSDIDRYAGTSWATQGTAGSWRPTAREKYQALLQQLGAPASPAGEAAALRVRIQMAKDKAGKEVPEHDHSEGKRLAYRRVISLARYEADNKAAGSPGVLVLTGHPNTKKHMDFVFVQPDPNAAWHDVDEAVIRRFLQLHDAEDGDWASWWKPRLRQGANVPVFYLEDEGGGVSAIGLSQLFRLPGPQTIGELVRGQQQQDDPRLDFVENLFGRIAGEDSALKGRVAFGDARLVDARQASQVLAGAAYQAETVLAQPKPSFALNYLEQDRKARGASTILDPNARVRGWKRYPVRPLAEVELVEPPKAGQPSNSRLQPLKEGLRFQAQVRLHNVMPEELGAIAWALTWGGQPQLRHALGMGKPFGFGQLEVEVLDAHIVANDAGAAAPDWRACMQAYAGYMQEQVRGWAATPQLRELQAMANPALPQARRDNLRPLSLNVGGANEFSQARNSWGARDGRNLVLEPYAGGTVKR